MLLCVDDAKLQVEQVSISAISEGVNSSFFNGVDVNISSEVSFPCRD